MFHKKQANMVKKGIKKKYKGTGKRKTVKVPLSTYDYKVSLQKARRTAGLLVCRVAPPLSAGGYPSSQRRRIAKQGIIHNRETMFYQECLFGYQYLEG